MKGVIIKVVSVVIILGIFIFLSLMPSNFNTKRGSRIWISEDRDIYFYESDKRGKMIVGNEVEDIFMETEKRSEKSMHYMDFYQTDSNCERRFNLMYGEYFYQKFFKNVFVLRVIQLYGKDNHYYEDQTIKNIVFRCYNTKKTDIEQLNEEMLEKASENDPIEYDCVRIYDPIKFNDEKSFFEMLEYYNVPKDSVKDPKSIIFIGENYIVSEEPELIEKNKIAENIYSILENLKFTGKYVNTFSPSYDKTYINFWHDKWDYKKSYNYFSEVRNQDVDEIPYGILHIRMNYDDMYERAESENYPAQILCIDIYRSGDVLLYNQPAPQPNNGKLVRATIYATATSLEEVDQAFLEIENFLEDNVTRVGENGKHYVE